MKNKKEKKKTTRGRIIKNILSGLFSILLVILLVASNTLLPSISKMGNNVLGYNKSIDNSKIDDKGLDLEYNSLDFSKDTISSEEEKLANNIAGEGIVLLKNDNKSMPFKKETKFSFFGANSVNHYSEIESLLASMFGGAKGNLKEIFEKEGFQVNDKMWEFYAEGDAKDFGLGPGSLNFGVEEDFSINEAPLSLLSDEEGLLKSAKDTVPVFVLQRVAGEGRDMPRSMYNHADNEDDKLKSYLEPNSTELEIIKYLNDNFDDVVLLVNSNAALELDWVNDYDNINSIVYSQSITDPLSKVFSGEINPSGRTVDTFAADALASPAAQNFGDYQYYSEDGEETVYNYVTYAEGIYIGYKYYETRYEDVILSQGNAGDFNYNNEVVYPFGYGLSYTDFEWSNYKVTERDDQFVVSLDVKNVGNVTGKDVVEIFMQSPYTEYDKQNNIEKSSVELVGYEKTKALMPGESQSITIKFSEEQLKSYDYVNAKTYILDAGDYQITAAKNAHDAVNNILAKKGKSTNDGMTFAGNKELVSTYTPTNVEVDSSKYANDTKTGTEISNQFEEAQGDAAFLTRNDWQGTFPKSDGEPSEIISTWGNEINGIDEAGSPASYTRYKIASRELIGKMDSTDSLSPVDKESLSDKPVYGKDNGLSLIELRGLDMDDPLWNDLLDQLTPEDYQTLLINSGYGTEAIDSIGKPFNIDADSASGLIYGGTGASFPNMMVLAQTWNQELALDYGVMIGNEAIIGGADGWYAPSMNIHRTPFTGRNGEYYSEDAFLSGTVASKEVSGVASKGMYTFIKHFAVNDQENHRGDRDGQYGLITWSNEQAIRELYLEPFEMSIKVDDIDLNFVKKTEDGTYENATTKIKASQGVMSAFNRLGATWTGGSYPLITGVLRDEWGFEGFVITDNANTGVFMDAFQMIEAGADAKLLNAKDPTNFKFNKDSVSEYHYGRKSVHRILYTIANSKAMNGAMPGSEFKQGVQKITIIRVIIGSVCILLLTMIGWFTYRRFKKDPITKDQAVKKINKD